MSTRVVISFDFELGWGVLESNAWQLLESKGVYCKMRKDIPTVLTLLDKYSVKTTWATVSGLLDPEKTVKNLDHLPANYKESVDNFVINAKTETKNGRDIADLVLGMGDLCEVGSHTTTHVNANHPTIKECHYVNDVMLSFDSLEIYSGKKIETLIFPRDEPAHSVAISSKKRGLNIRLNPRNSAGKSSIARKLLFAFDYWSNVPRSNIYNGGFSDTYHTGSLYFNMCGNGHRAARSISLKKRVNRLLKQIKKCNDDSIYHVWLHPFNLSLSEYNLHLFCYFIEQLGIMQKSGIVNTVLMKNISKLLTCPHYMVQSQC